MEYGVGFELGGFDFSCGWCDKQIAISFCLDLYDEKMKSSSVRLEFINLFLQLDFYW